MATAVTRCISNVPDDMKPFYALGINVALQTGFQLKTVLSPEEMAVMVSGYSDSMQDKVENPNDILKAHGTTLNDILTGRADNTLSSEKARGADHAEQYVAENPSAVRTESGLVFHETTAGTGDHPEPGIDVLVHYHGTYIDGKVFDSSMDRGEAVKFPSNQVIKGWQEGLALMKAGSKATMVIPSDLAYGDTGSPPAIPPGATLVFDVELIEIFNK
eukprot:CAMPEP_0114424356 /NCGR_PEP_ID=MMETSP0103-20121206/6649_1 /TAXON_ID=37642 ORGANISM="Paraphysomonas imperforata, Strain PA2" /NCGR_SAMPLE_ID=MMETSP0103 /ASSEMBLY_ACC=CAM_ASM_000201 /LENGTH=216 /DNA_ID=CAMNT_0001593101 /DNA_START=95 /DNA_END=745 /DNA_ORIENTATION=-